MEVFDILKSAYEILASFLLIILVAITIILFMSYLWSSIVYGTILKACGYDKPWLVWIPILRYWAISWLMTDDNDSPVSRMYGVIPMLDIVLKLFWLWIPALVYTPVVGPILSIVFWLFFSVWLYTAIAAKCLGTYWTDELAMGIVSTIIPLVAMIRMTTWLGSLRQSIED